MGALAAPEAAFKKNIIEVLSRTETHDERGQFSLQYRSADGTVVSESGALKPSHDGKGYVLVKEGEYSFIADDGKTYNTKYVADDKGFRAQGEHLPKSVVA